jgi:hypothetical protein
MAAGHVGKALDLARSSSSLSLTYVGILIVNHICSAKASTGAAGYGTRATGNAALVIFIPHRMAL